MRQYILNDDGSELEITYEFFYETNEDIHPQTEEEFRTQFDSAIETLYNQKDYWSLETLRNLARLLASDDNEGDRTANVLLAARYLTELNSYDAMLAQSFLGALRKHSE